MPTAIGKSNYCEILMSKQYVLICLSCFTVAHRRLQVLVVWNMDRFS
jgi:hypothetical protein